MSELTFQNTILTLEKFWASQGCLIWHPYNLQVGAGTMNPATALRVLGAEPWNVAYLEPSVRPDDGRYGQNPNRLNQHYQYQVILQPAPANPQELYLQSLLALGINPAEHDIRFVEDNWESPALGAWGLGWEVWLDGQEITQFTYFQQAGGQNLRAPAVEITYGLERIVMGLRGIRDFKQIPWTEQVLYGDVNLQGEQEHSRYHFELANVQHLRQLFDIYEAEAQTCLQAGLVLPAHDYVLRCSHTFNILDTRGAVGVTERAQFFRRMRGLARAVSKAYTEQRVALGLPFEAKILPINPPTPAVQPPMPTAPTSPQPYLLEIGIEELPAADVQNALHQLQTLVPTLFANARLAHGTVQYIATPRRLAVLVADVATQQTNLSQLLKGPAVRAAYNADGKPTPAAVGFARGKGVAVEALIQQTVDGVAYVFAAVSEPGLPAPTVLAEIALKLIGSLSFGKTMRWLPDDATAFSRPLRWFVSLLGDTVVPFQYASCTAAQHSYGLRSAGSPIWHIPHAAAYPALLAEQHIVGDLATRQALIWQQVQALAATVGGSVTPDPDLLAEVTNLVESPTAFCGAFEPEFLQLPAEVLLSVMKHHQRYFAVRQADEQLLPYFIGVRNGDADQLQRVVDGNQQVIRARFADAAYFVRADQMHPLETFRPKLAKLTFQEQLGSMLAKSERILQLTNYLAQALQCDATTTAIAERTAFLCKADLATQMVAEDTGLQGIIGREYALSSGESAAVAAAIAEHYAPNAAGATLPTSHAAVVVGLADRLDSLVGLFAAGLAPTGSADPFALRRTALGLVQLLLGKQLDFDLQAALSQAATLQPITVSDAICQQVKEFCTGRLRGLLAEAGYRYDVIESALREQANNPLRALQATAQLAEWVILPDWGRTLAAFARCVRITRKIANVYAVHPAAFTSPAEQALHQATTVAQLSVAADPSVSTLLQALQPLIPVIDHFFEQLLVMDPDPAVRANRLALLQAVAELSVGIVDLSQLQGF
jgi:glycyl-tRNA synthetase